MYREFRMESGFSRDRKSSFSKLYLEINLSTSEDFGIAATNRARASNQTHSNIKAEQGLTWFNSGAFPTTGFV